jgi:LmbE family N-acetylglucosaminyl deacetylase
LKTLVVVAHLDDETFGLGGTLLKLCKEDHNNVKVLVMCKGRDRENAEIRMENFYEIFTRLRCVGVICDNYDLTLHEKPLNVLADIISDHIRRFEPDTVICTGIDDIHQEHGIVSRATRVACRPHTTNVKELLEFKIPGSSTEDYNIAVDITDELPEKIDLCGRYVTEIKDGKVHPNSIQGILDINIGDGTRFGLGAAELLRVVWSCKEF